MRCPRAWLGSPHCFSPWNSSGSPGKGEARGGNSPLPTPACLPLPGRFTAPLSGVRWARVSSPPMTWSIIARDAASGAFGVAIATRFFAVGALCPYAQSGVGALSTQALMNPHYGPQGLELLRAGLAAAEVVKRLIAPDEGREQRQVHVIDAAGRVGQHTGAACVDWCGATSGDGYSVAGNMLAGKSVIDFTAR